MSRPTFAAITDAYKRLHPAAFDNRRDAIQYGDGFTAKTPIEGAARLGYLDALARVGFRLEYDAAEGQWQRNYEAGRQWATAILAIGLEPAMWEEGERVPRPLLEQLGQVRTVTGSGTRPEDNKGAYPAPDDKPVLAIVPVIRRGRIIERVSR